MANKPEGVLYSPCVVEYSPIGMLALVARHVCSMAGDFLFYLREDMGTPVTDGKSSEFSLLMGTPVTDEKSLEFS